METPLVGNKNFFIRHLPLSPATCLPLTWTYRVDKLFSFCAATRFLMPPPTRQTVAPAPVLVFPNPPPPTPPSPHHFPPAFHGEFFNWFSRFALAKAIVEGVWGWHLGWLLHLGALRVCCCCFNASLCTATATRAAGMARKSKEEICMYVPALRKFKCFAVCKFSFFGFSTLRFLFPTPLTNLFFPHFSQVREQRFGAVLYEDLFFDGAFLPLIDWLPPSRR